MTSPDWREMSRELFDVDAPAAGLFDVAPGMTAAPDDGAGTGDLFTLL